MKRILNKLFPSRLLRERIARLEDTVERQNKTLVTGEPYEVPNFVVHVFTEHGYFGAYYVPQAKDEEHAINQVRQWMFEMFGLKAPWKPEYEGEAFVRITEMKAKKLNNSEIHAL